MLTSYHDNTLNMPLANYTLYPRENVTSYSNLQPSLSFEQRVKAIHEEMNRRATNLGYGLGVGLRNAIEESKESSASNESYFSQLWGKVTQFFQGWFSDTENTSETCETSRRKQPPDLILDFVLNEAADFNYAFDDSIFANTMNMITLDQLGYRLQRIRISDPIEICMILKTDDYKNIIFDAMILSGHGKKMEIDFGKQALSVQNIHVLSCLPQHLKQNAKLILNSCSTGKIELINGLYPYKISTEKKIGTYEYVKYFWEGKEPTGEPIALSLYRYLEPNLSEIEIVAPSLDFYNLYIYSIYPLKVVMTADNAGDFYDPFYSKQIDAAVLFNQKTVNMLDELNRADRERNFRNAIRLTQALNYDAEEPRYLMLSAFVQYCEKLTGSVPRHYKTEMIASEEYHVDEAQHQEIVQLLKDCDLSSLTTINVPHSIR